jgi:hypothetical protein
MVLIAIGLLLAGGVIALMTFYRKPRQLPTRDELRTPGQ